MKTRMISALAVLALMMSHVLFAGRALGQTAPAGNEHPETSMVTGSEGGEGAAVPNPFGSPEMPRTLEGVEKHAFAAGVDLEPLRTLAVFHSGRVKILDTLARETVSVIAGRKTYFDLGEAAGKEGLRAKLSYDPMFTLLDLMIDPGYYADKPLIQVGYLPLRREILEREFPGDGASVERWMKLTRVTPIMIQKQVSGIMEAHGFEQAYAQAVGRVDEALSLWGNSPSNLMMVAPDRKDLPWNHVTALPEGHPARAAALAVGAAWRAGDAGKASAAVLALATELRKINPEQYPAGRASLESFYNRLNAFEWGMWAYCTSLVAFLLAMGTGRKWLMALGVSLLVGAIGMHATGFVARCLIAERFAIQNQFESMTGLSLFGAVVGLGLLLVKRQALFAAAAAALGFMVLITATQTGIPGEHIEREAAILNTSILLKYHVTTVLVSYSLITLGFVCSVFYLGTYYMAKLRRPAAGLATVGGAAVMTGGEEAAGAGGVRTLVDLDRAQMIVLQLAFWTLGVGILLGAWWADHSWGRWWAFDPKETWALITWIVYLIVIHVRLTTGKDRGLVTAWLSVLGFIAMLWTYFGVNLLLPGLHAYA